VRDPEETELGKQIITKGIELIYETGFDKFTFKKLAITIKSNEPSIYRYFENKQQLLAYLHSWYWSWIEYNIDNNLKNIKSFRDKINIIIQTLTNSFKYDNNFKHIDEEKLSNIVIRDYQSIFISQDKEKYDTFDAFESLLNRISIVIKEAYPKYETPNALAVSLIKFIHDHMFFIINKNKLSEIKNSESLGKFTYKTFFSNI
ncbi:MAG: TetR/AcrR family transcriptional regulator, partial [Candidatus Sericytochromatia bacterium]